MGDRNHRRAVVDRIVENKAVVLLEAAGEATENDELTVPVTALPELARKEGSVLAIEFTDGELSDIRHDAEATATQRQRIQDKLDRLSRPLSDESDDH